MKGIGIISNIMNIVQEISLGKYHFELAILLRESILLNSKTWVEVTNDDIEMLEAVDRIMMRRILDVPISTSKPALYLELGCIPIRYIIKARRLLFLQYILKRNKNETISKVFWAQKENPVKNDWWLQVEQDLKEFQLYHAKKKHLNFT